MEVRSSDQPLCSSNFPSWVIVEKCICRKELASLRDSDPTSAEATATNGELVRVSFVLRPFPAASHLCIYFSEGRELSSFDTVVAAHGDAVLFRLKIDYEGRLADAWRHAVDYFVYRASLSGPSRLSLLPRHYSTEDEMEAAEVGSWRRNPRIRMGLRHVGLLLTGDGGDKDFVVAELHLDPRRLEDDADAPLEAQLIRLCCSSDRETTAGEVEWEVKHARARGGKAAKFRDLLCWWDAHVVVPYRNYLCRVDYSRGVIFCEVNQHSPELHYLALPVDHIPVGYPDPCRIGWPQSSRAVCITKDGSGTTMKSVHISRSDGMLSDESQPGCCFAITISTLVHRGGDGDMGWEKDVTIEDDKLWDMEGYHDQLPRIAPEFPLLSVDDPNIFYFVLRKRFTVADGARAWIVALDMESSKVLWYKYVKATASDDNLEMIPSNIFCNAPFFPTEF